MNSIARLSVARVNNRRDSFDEHLNPIVDLALVVDPVFGHGDLKLVDLTNVKSRG